MPPPRGHAARGRRFYIGAVEQSKSDLNLFCEQFRQTKMRIFSQSA